MSLSIGIDIGTSGVKAVLFDETWTPVAEAARPIAVSRPHVGWSEQDAGLWVEAVWESLDRLAAAAGARMGGVAGIGLSGQMLAALILDSDLKPLRPAMLWNDQRAIAECAELLARVPDIGWRTNGTPDPGITAPKLIWLARHEPEAVRAGRMLMLTKDYVRLAMTGDVMSEPTDAGGTGLFDCAAGRWDDGLCAAAGWDPAYLPPVTESWAAAGALRPELARRWGLRPGIPVAAGAGDNMASTLGVGAARPGDAVLTVGTSGVACIVDHAFHPGPEAAILTSAHAAPETFLSMGVVMSATASLDWSARITGTDARTLAAEAEGFAARGRLADAPVFLPTLTGIRTPLNRPDALGAMAGLHPETTRAMLGYATMEGVAFQFADCIAAQEAAGVHAANVASVGGGTRSRLWVSLIATRLGRDIALPPGAHVAATLGAARLGAVAAGAPVSTLGLRPPAERVVPPDEALAPVLAERYERYRALLPEKG